MEVSTDTENRYLPGLKAALRFSGENRVEDRLSLDTLEEIEGTSTENCNGKLSWIRW